MTMPTRGLCHSVFLLAYAAQSKHRLTLPEWVAAARQIPTFMASALAIDSAAQMLLEDGLAVVDENGVHIDPRLAGAGDEANTEILATIAAILLAVRPPPWFRTAVRRGSVAPEFIPTQDEESLSWLDKLRDPILLDLAAKKENEDTFRIWLGGLGEKLVLDSERHRGRRIVHVSRISDYFGYDIETHHGHTAWQIEVKTCLSSNADQFFISRNEANRALQLASTWRLVQVIFDPAVTTVANVTIEHIVSARTLSAWHLVELLPKDSDTGVWIDSARISPQLDAWAEWKIDAPPSWTYPGYLSATK